MASSVGTGVAREPIKVTPLIKAICNCGAKQSDPNRKSVIHSTECSVYKSKAKSDERGTAR